LDVHSVDETAVTRDGVAEIVDFERALKPRREEASKGCDYGGKKSQKSSVDVEPGEN
jgi:hypothetical protein